MARIELEDAICARSAKIDIQIKRDRIGTLKLGAKRRSGREERRNEMLNRRGERSLLAGSAAASHAYVN